MSDPSTPEVGPAQTEDDLLTQQLLAQPEPNTPSTRPPTPRPRTPQNLTMSKDSARSIPKIEPRLAGQHNYAEWVSSVEMALTMYDIGSHTIWDIVTGTCTSIPAAAASSTAGSSDPGKATATATTTVTEAEWTKANYFAVLTMCTTCEPGALSKIGITKDAAQAYKNLKAHYEGKTVTDLGVFLA